MVESGIWLDIRGISRHYILIHISSVLMCFGLSQLKDVHCTFSATDHLWACDQKDQHEERPQSFKDRLQLVADMALKPLFFGRRKFGRIERFLNFLRCGPVCEAENGEKHSANALVIPSSLLC